MDLSSFATLDLWAKHKLITMRTQDELLEILAYAISDVGLWTWYSSDFPKYLQLEFNRTLLNFNQGEKDKPPSHQIALQLRDIKAVFVSQETESKLPENWLELLNQDKLKPLDVAYDQFSFDPQDVKFDLEHASNLKKIFGKDYSEDLKKAPFQLHFSAGEVGMFVFAEEMKIWTHKGEVPLEKIEEIHKDWWGYWKRYWELRETTEKLPYDDLCEITIPITEK